MDLDAVRRARDRWLPAFLEGRRGPIELYAPDVHTWHAATGAVMPIDPTTNDPSFARLRAAVPDLRREDVRTESFAGGWVVQATTVGTVDGAEVRVNACLVARLDDEGRIARFEEYADSASAAPFVRALTN